MINLAPSSTCKSDAILDSSWRPYDSSDSEEKVSSFLSRVGEGRGESEEGKNLGLDRKCPCLDSEPTSKQARMGVQSSLTWSWSSESLEEKALPELQT
jgi:hypothetical protein